MADKDYEYFLKTDLSEYEGQCVAIVNAKIVAHDVNFKKAFDMARKLFPQKEPFIACVPRSDVAMLF